MNILLKPNLEEFITEKVKAGQYPDASGVVNDALEMLWEQDHFTPEHEAYLRRELRLGLDQLVRGERADFTAEKIIAEERQRRASEQPHKATGERKHDGWPVCIARPGRAGLPRHLALHRRGLVNILGRTHSWRVCVA